MYFFTERKPDLNDNDWLNETRSIFVVFARRTKIVVGSGTQMDAKYQLTAEKEGLYKSIESIEGLSPA